MTERELVSAPAHCEVRGRRQWHIASASPRKRLWLFAGGVALFLMTIFGARTALLPQRQASHRTIAVDFIAFYTAGEFVRERHLQWLYDLRATQHFQHDLALRFGQDIGSACGPWWNPPFYALLFVPLARLPYPVALNAWIALNLLCAALACWLLVGLLPRGTSWRTWALVPVLMALSTPFIHAISHAQNTCASLLILIAAVTLWHRQRGLLAGIGGGLLFYKPQLAAVLAVVMAIDLGWSAIVGFAITGAGLLLAAILALPGTLGDYLHRLPENLHHVQAHTVYVWERHVTFKAFWRLLLQGRGIAETSTIVTLLSAGCATLVGIMLARALITARRARFRDSMPSSVTRDRIISAAVAATPLLMPFYFDYDQLLLTVPAVLLARELMSRARADLNALDRALLITWPIYYVWLMVNPDVAEKTRINFSVPLLATIACLLAARLCYNTPTRGSGRRVRGARQLSDLHLGYPSTAVRGRACGVG